MCVFRANLSESYFTNRQDRYVLLQNSTHIADFFSRLVGAVSSVSFHLQSDNSLELSDDLKVHPFLGESGLPWLLVSAPCTVLNR